MKDLNKKTLKQIEDALSNYEIEFDAATLNCVIFVEFQGRKYFKVASHEEGNPQKDNKFFLWLIWQVREQIINYLQKNEETSKKKLDE